MTLLHVIASPALAGRGDPVGSSTRVGIASSLVLLRNDGERRSVGWHTAVILNGVKDPFNDKGFLASSE